MRTADWRQLAVTTRYELKLILRDPGFRGLFILCQLVILFYAWRYDLRPGNPVGPVLDDLASIFGLVLAVVVAVYAVHNLRRGSLEGADEVLAGLPTRPAPELWGKALAGSAAGACVAAEPLLLGAVLGRGEPELAGLLLYHGGFLATNLGLAVAFGFLASVLLRRPALGYPAAAGAWIGYTVAVNWLVYTQGLTRVSLALNFAGGVGYHRTDPLWGASLDLPLALPQYAFLGALGLGLLALGVLAYRPGREPGRPRPLTAAVLFLAVAVAVICGQAYLERLEARFASLSRQLELEDACAKAEGMLPPHSLELGGYEVTLWLGHDHGVAADVTLEVVNATGTPLGRLPFILNGVFAVQEVLVTGRGARFEAVGHRVTVDLDRPLEPGVACHVRFRYRGTVLTYNRYDGLAGPTLVAGTWGRGTLLPAGFAWYPLPGYTGWYELPGRAPPGQGAPQRVVLATRVHWRAGPGDDTVTGLAYAARDLGTVPFALTVHAPAGQVIACNLPLVERAGAVTRFAGLAENGCYVLGGPDVRTFTVPPDTVSVVGAGALAPRLETLARHAQAAVDFLRGLGAEDPSLPEPVITVVTGAGWHSWFAPTLGGTAGFHGLTQTWVAEAPRHPTGAALAVEHEAVFGILLGRLLPSATDAAVREAYVVFARALFLAECYGEEFYAAAREAALTSRAGFPGSLSETAREGAEALFRHADRHGLAAASELCARLYPAVRDGELDLHGLLDAAAGGGEVG